LRIWDDENNLRLSERRNLDSTRRLFKENVNSTRRLSKRMHLETPRRRSKTAPRRRPEIAHRSKLDNFPKKTGGGGGALTER
jgi:hypothetical protein